MELNNLKSLWHDALAANDDTNYYKMNIEKSIAMKHSKVISKTLSDIRLKILIYALVLIIYSALMIYAFVYLELHLTIYSLFPLTLAGSFLLLLISTDIARLRILTRTADNLTVKETSQLFQSKLDRMRTTDFVSCLFFFYMSATLIIYNYLSDIGGVKNLSWDNNVIPAPLVGILVLMLLSIPWFLRYQHDRRYRKLYSNLNESLGYPEDIER
jgi:hypothetical protein